MKLFLDDERYPVGDDWAIVRSSAEAIAHCQTNGCPEYISFDHDLGGEDTSVIFLKWLINRDLDEWENHNKSFIPKNFDYYVHSQNPVGKKRLEDELRPYIQMNQLRQSLP